jgi:tripartite-type tricarboxylate transporter receptor subunit TctC
LQTSSSVPACGRGVAAGTPIIGRVRWAVGYPRGGGADIEARIIGVSLAERLGKQIIIQNRPGAAANIATERVVRSDRAREGKSG